MSLTSPAPGATESRTDQGKDWSNVKKVVAVGAGKITDILNLQGFGTTIIEKLSNYSDQYGPYVYYGEESGGGSPEVHTGQDVQAGQEIAPGTGGVIEAGWWDPSTGRSKGAPGFSESNPSTAAGRDFFAAVSGKQSPTITRPGGAGSGGQGGSGGPDPIFAAYQEEVAMPRRAPPQSGFTRAQEAGWKAPFKWWLQSFTAKWEADLTAGAKAQGQALGQGALGDTSGIPKKGTLTPNQIAQLAKAAGFTGENLVIAVAVALAESGGDTQNKSYNPGSVDRGLFQINSLYNSDTSDACAYDPVCNTKMAFHYFQTRGWRDWTTYTTGRYQQYMGQARQAAASVGG